MTRARDVADTQDNTGGAVAPFLAGKNKIINGDFRINQRAFSSTTSNNTFTFDRWRTTIAGTQTFSSQTFTAGTAPVVGYEGANFLQCITTTGAGTYALIDQPIEDVRTFANQTVTLSFWARAASGTPKIAIQLAQSFGSGGSSEVGSTLTAITISTSWTRYSLTIALPSISGKTIGTSSSLKVIFVFANDYEAVIGQQAATFQIWGIQLEAGNVATPFTTATGTIQGELAACQRYYYRITLDADNRVFGGGFFDSTTVFVGEIQFPTTMRIRPTALETTGTVGNYQAVGPAYSQAGSSIVFDGITTENMACVVISGINSATTGRAGQLRSSGANRYLAWSAEL